MHIRLMACGAALIALAGCLQVQDNPVVQTPTGAEISIQDGLNCWQNRCFNYDAENNRVSLAGREPVAVDALGGSVTVDEFAALLAAAASGASTSVSDNDDGGSSAPSGGGGVGAAPSTPSFGGGDD